MTSLVCVLSAILISAGSPAPSVAPQARQFDFWIGAWDVNLRVRQTDGTWKDEIQALAYIYPILDGKAILELWSATPRDKGRKGYSLRYYRDDIGQWELWLNWPGRNNAGSGFLRGAFRHNRGEFFSDDKQADSSTLRSRYTFSDITPTSLRWDDAFSEDGGKTWTNRWIMEFSRRSALPPALSTDEPANSYGDGSLCDAPEFRQLEKLSGRRTGSMRYRASANEAWQTSSATLVTHRIVGGCATISFLEYFRNGAQYKRFAQNSYNTARKAFEIGELDNAPGATYRSFLGQTRDSGIVFDGVEVDTETPTGYRSVWRIAGNSSRLEEYRKVGEVWVLIAEGTFTGAR